MNEPNRAVVADTPVLADAEGTDITPEAWEAMTVAERSVAAVVGAARRREFAPDGDGALVRALTTAARGEFVPRSRPFEHLHEALWSVWGTERPNDDLWGVLWDPEARALSFVPVGAPVIRCTNLWFGAGEDGDAVAVDGDNGPAGAAPVVLWAADDEVAEGIRDWCGAEAAATAELAALRASIANGTVTDGFHSFPELYESRLVLHAYAVEAWQARGWPVVKSWRHEDGEPCFGGEWLIVHVVTPQGPASFHYPAAAWDLFDVPAVETAPAFDGHTTADVHARLRGSLGVGRGA